MNSEGRASFWRSRVPSIINSYPPDKYKNLKNAQNGKETVFPQYRLGFYARRGNVSIKRQKEETFCVSNLIFFPLQR